MAACVGCGGQLAGRRQKCDACRGATGAPAKRPARRAKATSRKATTKRSTRKAAAAAAGAPIPEPTQTPDGLKARGARLWASLAMDVDTPSGAIALEACRTADRLDELDRVIAGKGVLHLMQFRLQLDLAELAGDDNNQMTIKVQVAPVLTESRQQQAAFASLLTTLGVAKPDRAAVPPTPMTETPASGLADLTKRREERRERERKA